MISSLRLGPGAEFDRLRAIFARLGSEGQGLGDDTALVRLGGTTLAASVDLSLEGVHFHTAWLSFAEIGWRATAAALSDLAAEGAKPVGILVSLGVPGGRGKGEEGRGDPGVEIMGGVAAAAKHVGAKVLGGDLVRAERYLVDVCVLGTAVRPVRRSGARPGDGVWVTGALGGAALALDGFRSGAPPMGALRRRFARPEPRIAAGRWLARHGARAMIDISDGLAADAGQLAAASGIALEIELERIPCWAGVAPRAAAASGEEYELLVALPRGFGDRSARAFTRASGLALTAIGRCTAGRGVRLTAAGRTVPAPGGFDHFAAR
jgi:thiamine-monophosphate kinase